MPKPHRISILPFFALLALCLGSCVSQDVGYYATKAIWNRPLKTEARIDCFMDCGVDTYSPARGHSRFVDTKSNEGWYDYFVDRMREEMTDVKHVLLTDSAAEFELSFTEVKLQESITHENCGGEDFYLGLVRVDLTFTLALAGGEVITTESVSTHEDETLKHKTDDEGNAYCVERLFQSISMESALRRAVDKVVSVSTNKLRRHRKRQSRSAELKSQGS